MIETVSAEDGYFTYIFTCTPKATERTISLERILILLRRGGVISVARVDFIIY